MICRNCNTNNPDNVKFCARCGAPLFTNNRPDYGAQGYADQRYVNPGYVDPRYADPRYADPRYANPGYGYPYNQPASPPLQGLAIASMICGIISFFVNLFVFMIPSLLAIIFGAVAKGKGNKSGMATAGIVCGSISLALYILLWLMVFTMVGLHTY